MKLKKIIALGLAVLTVMLGTMMTVSAATVAESDITVKVNGNEVDFPDQYPVI